MMRPDLHLHTTASDGIYDAVQLARLVQRADVTLFSITDHDTMAALPSALDAAYDRGLAFLTGVEISTENEEDVHILGYGVKPDDPVLNETFQKMAQDRLDRVSAMTEKLEKLGMPLPFDEIKAQAGRSIGRPHLARGMVKMGYVSSAEEAFDRFLSPGKPAYLPRPTLRAAQAISLLRERGAVPVLAHPGELKWPEEKFLPLFRAWLNAGLQGLEVYHPANRGRYAAWDRLARKHHLLVTGGSDFHDHGPRHGQIGETIPEWPDAGRDGWALYQAAHR